MLRIILAATFLLPGSQSLLFAEDTSAKTTTVKLKALTLNIPATWTQGKKRSSMRLATFEIPAVEGDDDNAELAIYSFPGGGGSVGANINRWVGQFSGKGRQKMITKGKAGEHNYYMVEVSGTYNQSVGPPIQRKTKAVEGSRMLAVILQLDEGVYFLKLTGQDKTVKAQSQSLRESFGGTSESEEEHKS